MPSWSSVAGSVERRFCDALELRERLAHPLTQLACPVRRNVDNAGPRGKLLRLVRLRDTRGPLDGLELVTPHRGLLPALLGDEGELVAGVRDQNAPTTRPFQHPSRATAV